jgi:predicted DNA-binding ribbon-helix-helix protein
MKRSFSFADRRTSVALEPEFWRALEHIAASRQQTLVALVSSVEAQHSRGQWASALRVFALEEFFRPRQPARNATLRR